MQHDSTIADDTATLTRDEALKSGRRAIKGYGPNKTTMRDHNRRTFAVALECAAAGLPVIECHSIDDSGECTCQWAAKRAVAEGRKPPAPCATPGKHPRGSAWQRNATTDFGHIVARWSGAKTYYNVGVVFGADSGVVIVDSDGPEGQATLSQWQSGLGLPDTVTVISGSDGLHLYYRVPPEWDIRNSVKAIGPGLDVRGEHGFSVAPASRHKAGIASRWKDGEGVYGWQPEHGPDDIKIADAPMWLLRRMWFATKDRRHATAPDGSKWVDAGLPEETEPTSAREVDPFQRAAARMGATSDGVGWEGKIALIGHGPGTANSYDAAINEVCNSYLGTYGHEADATLLKAAIVTRVREAPENTPGHRDRYLTDDYLDERIEKSREWVKSKGAEATKREPPHPGVVGFDGAEAMLAEVDAITADAPDDVIESLLLRIHASDIDETAERMMVRRIGRKMDGVERDSRYVREMWEAVTWHADHGRPDTVNVETVREYMNRRYAAMRWGKDFVYADLTRRVIQPITAASLTAEYKDTCVKVRTQDGEETVPNWFTWWDKQAGKPRFDEVVFKPRGYVARHQLNLFRGFGVKPIEGQWTLLRRHIYENVCNRNAYRFAYLVYTFASWVQRPDIKNGVAIVLRGAKGTGKSKVAEWLCELMPHNSVTVSSPDHLFSEFNANEAYALIVNVAEAFWAGDKKHENRLKSMITDPKQPLQPKGLDRIEVGDFHHFVMTTNEDWAVPATFDERRFYVLDVNPRHAKDTTYFAAIDREMESGGLEAMLHDLLTMAIPDWCDLRNPPRTKALTEQAELSGEPHEQWWREVLDTGEIIIPPDRDGGEVTVPWEDGRLEMATRHVQLAYEAFAKKCRGGRVPLSSARLGRFLRQMCGCPDGEDIRRRETGCERQWLYDLPPLAQLREHYTTATGATFDERDETVLPAGVTEQARAFWAMWGRGMVEVRGGRAVVVIHPKRH